MRDSHPSPESWAALRRGELDERSAAEFLAHVSCCRECGKWWKSSPQVQAPLKLEIPKEAYSSVLDKVFSNIIDESERLEGQRLLAPELLQELLSLSPGQRNLVVHNSQRYQVWPLAEELLAESRRGWRDDPVRAEELAELSLVVASHLEKDDLHDRLLNDLCAEAWSYVGNCRRIQSDLAAAAEAFDRAESYLEQGSGDALERARLLDLKASLLAERRNFEMAISLLGEAVRCYRNSKERHLEGRALVKLAKILYDKGRVEESISATERATNLLDLAADPDLALLLKRNLVWYLAEVGRLAEASRLMAEVRGIAHEHGGRLGRLRMLWTEGMLRQKLGQFEMAEAALRQVREGFIAAEIGYDVALVSLDLAALLLTRGRTSEVRRLAKETMPIFASRSVQRELLVAWQLFNEAAEREVATLRLVQELSARIRSSHEASLGSAKSP